MAITTATTGKKADIHQRQSTRVDLSFFLVVAEKKKKKKKLSEQTPPKNFAIIFQLVLVRINGTVRQLFKTETGLPL